MNSANNSNKIGNGVKFERIRRITGYLVGTVERFNDGKKAEEKEKYLQPHKAKSNTFVQKDILQSVHTRTYVLISPLVWFCKYQYFSEQ